MEEETRSLKGLRTIYTEEQRQWFKDHCAKFSVAQWCVIMNTDKTGVHNMAARFKNIRFKRGAPTTNCDNVLIYKHEFERMDWNHSRGIQRTKDVKDSISLGKKKINVNITMNYDESRNMTDITLSTPVYSGDF